MIPHARPRLTALLLSAALLAGSAPLAEAATASSAAKTKSASAAACTVTSAASTSRSAKVTKAGAAKAKKAKSAAKRRPAKTTARAARASAKAKARARAKAKAKAEALRKAADPCTKTTTPATPKTSTTPPATTPAPAPSTTPPASTTTPAPHAAPQPVAGAPAAGNGFTLGLNANTGGAGPDTGLIQSRIAANGVRSLREEFDVGTFEPSVGQFAWSKYDRVIGEAAKRGISILPMVMGNPASTGLGTTALTGDPAVYAGAVAAVVRRYGAAGSFWTQNPTVPKLPIAWVELWNEPFLPMFAGGDSDAGRYARLVRAATTAGRQADPTVKYMMAVDTTYDVNAKPVDWIGALYAADPNLNQVFDAVTVHPYGDVDGYTPGWNRWQFRRIEQIRATLVARGAADKPFFVTEIGYSTCPAGASAGCVTEAQQSAKIAQVITALRTTYGSFVRGAWVYGYLDSGSGAANDSEGYYGLLRRDGSPKPGWAAINSLISQS